MSIHVEKLLNATQDFTKNLKENTSSEDFAQTFKKELKNFYEIHQQSQISGVSTSKYNAALSALGFDPTQNDSAFKAIALLEVSGFSTGTPSDEAILKYGALQQEHGNKSYMKNSSAENKAIEEEIDTINDLTDDFYEDSKNYYDMAERRATATQEEKEQLLATLNSSQNIEQNEFVLSKASNYELDRLIKNHISSLFDSKVESVLANILQKID